MARVPSITANRASRAGFGLLAGTSTVLALAGVILPLLPTTPFLLLAVWAAGRGSPALQQWLLQHRRLGPVIEAWHDRGAVPLSGKWLACILMPGSWLILWSAGAPLAGLLLAGVFFSGVAGFILTRPTA